MTIDLEALYVDLHRHPELSFQETRTASVVAAHLRELGLDVEEGVGGTGVVGMLRNGDGPVVWMRADMDALPVEEQTGAVVREHRDRNGRVRDRGPGHACVRT